MFELPDDGDAFWDEFPLEDQDTDHFSVSGNATNKCGYSERVTVSKPTHFAYKANDFSGVRCQNEHFKEPGTATENCKAEADFGQGNSKTKDDIVHGQRNLKRKFPGPAGLLPPSMGGEGGNSSPVPLPDLQARSAPDPRDFKSPQEHSDLFSSPPWKTLLSDLDSNCQLVLDQFSIKAMLVQAGRKRLPKGKIPLIVGVIDSLTYQGADASLVIRDPSGKMCGSLHRDLVKDPESALQAGTAVVLRQVSVISPSPRTHYLNITPRNVVLIYSAPKEDCVVKSSWTSPSPLGLADLPCLRQIVKSSEEELLASSRRSLQKPSTMCFSPTLQVKPKPSSQWTSISKPPSIFSGSVSGATLRSSNPSTPQLPSASWNAPSSSFSSPLLSGSGASNCSMIPWRLSAACSSGSVSGRVTFSILQVTKNTDEFPDDDDDDLLQLCDADSRVTVGESTSRQNGDLNQGNSASPPAYGLAQHSEQRHEHPGYDVKETEHRSELGGSSVFGSRGENNESLTYSKHVAVVDNSHETARQTMEIPAVSITQDSSSVHQNGHRKFTFRKSSSVLLPSVAVKRAAPNLPEFSTGSLAPSPFSERVNICPSLFSGGSKASLDLEDGGQQLEQVQRPASSSHLVAQRPPGIQLGKPCFQTGSDHVAENLVAAWNDDFSEDDLLSQLTEEF